MNRKELLETILKAKELNHLTKKDADKLLTTTFEIIKKTIDAVEVTKLENMVKLRCTKDIKSAVIESCLRNNIEIISMNNRMRK